MVKFIHAADLHLGLRITRFDKAACERIVEARFLALDRLRAHAQDLRVDFLLIAGDTFDDFQVSRATAERAFRIFEGKHMPCPVFLIPGNHDPLVPGGVWDRPPWKGESSPRTAFLLDKAEPFEIPGLPVCLFPCPLRHRRHHDDPTNWIADHPRHPGDNTVRIGLAHGSLNILPNLPDDDHLIDPNAAQRLGLDYLALGHWHKPLRHRSGDGMERTAYSGTHEPMRFPGGGDDAASGWSSYSRDGNADRFADAGGGTALMVTIDGPGAAPMIKEIDTGHLRWMSERREVTSATNFGQVVSEFAQMKDPDRVLLSLRLFGVLDPQTHTRLEDPEELLRIINGRFHLGSSLDARAVLVEPQPEQARELVGDGVLSRVLNKLQEEIHSPDAKERSVAEHALKLLYRIAWEARQA